MSSVLSQLHSASVIQRRQIFARYHLDDCVYRLYYHHL